MKLYIIGNGFDLAHNLKTGYPDYLEYVSNSKKWSTILDYYPKHYPFWSDIEYNVGNINEDLYRSIKLAYGTGFLSDLLKNIHDSFDSFILKTENKIFGLEPLFSLDKNSLFLTFNYTTTLEEVYKIPKDNIIYVHNDIGGPALKLLYSLENNQPCVIGHSPIDGDYVKRDINDAEYLDFIKKTTKNIDQIIGNKKIIDRLNNVRDKVKEVIFYGFSFSITDKEYFKIIFDVFKNKKTKFKVFYKVSGQKTEDECKLELKRKMIVAGVKAEIVQFINCETTTIL